MNKFEKQLEKWNNGVLRGAQAKLAKLLGVSTATTALWTTGKRHPSKGYVAKMADLFELDVYGVLKLFEPRSIVYPDLASRPAGPHVLYDKTLTDASYLAEYKATTEDIGPQSNSVKIPFLSAVPTQFPQYEEDTVIEWWSIPRRYALGAKYIIRSLDAALQGAQDEDDLCLIKPTATAVPGKLNLFVYTDGTCKLKYIKGTGKQTGTVLGIAVRRITGC